MLAQYVNLGVDELDQDKLAPLLKLKDLALPNAFAELGKADQVRHLYANGPTSGSTRPI